MAASTLDLETAFEGRAAQIGIEDHYVEKFVEKKFAAFGCCAFAAVYSPNRTDEVPPRRFLNDLLVEDPSSDQLACMRRLFFESHTMALTDAHQRAEASPDPLLATCRLATAQCVATQKDQETRLGGLVFTPETTPSNHLVGLFVDEGIWCPCLHQARAVLQHSPRGERSSKRHGWFYRCDWIAEIGNKGLWTHL